MAYNTKALKLDVNDDPISQFFSVAADDYYAVLGTANVGPHFIIFDTSGDELFTATNPANVQVTGSNAAAHESKTVDNTVGGVALTGGTYGTNIYALITAETAQMRFTVDGTAPTTAIGHLLNPGDTLELDSLADITAFRAIRTGSVSGVIKATYSGVA